METQGAMNQQPKPDVTIMKSEVDMALYHSATSSQGCILNTILTGIAQSGAVWEGLSTEGASKHWWHSVHKVGSTCKYIFLKEGERISS